VIAADRKYLDATVTLGAPLWDRADFDKFGRFGTSPT
jgi:hypothetical protein